MHYRIHRGSPAPAYLQLYEQIKADIVRGVCPRGSRLPSKRTLAEEAGTSVVTAAHACDLLCEEGYAESRQRSGFFVVFHPADGFAGAAGESPAPHARGAGHASPTAFPFSVLAKTMRRVMSSRGEAILDKAPNAGCEELRDALCRYLARSRGIEAERAQIVIGSGAEYLYGLIVGLLGRERLFALESPSYEKIEQVYRALGAACEFLPLGADGIESAALRSAGASILHISPYRSFPTGITASASKRYEYLRWASRPDHFLVEDDFESEFTILDKPEETLFALSRDDNVIYLNTFTRTISPSLRVGYMVLPRRLVPLFAERLGHFSCTVPTFEQLVLAELIDGGGFERHINRVRRAKRKALRQKAPRA